MANEGVRDLKGGLTDGHGARVNSRSMLTANTYGSLH